MSQLAVKTDNTQYVTFRLGGQRIALSLTAVRDVVRAQPITPIPHVSSAIAGLVNIRGRAVPALDLRACFTLPPYSDTHSIKLVVVEQDGERFALMVDSLDDVTTIAAQDISPLSANDAQWEVAATGIATHQGERIVLMDVAQFLSPFLK